MTLTQLRCTAIAALITGASLHAQQSAPAAKPYQNSFPVSHASAATAKKSAPASDGSLRLLPAVRPSNTSAQHPAKTRSTAPTAATTATKTTPTIAKTVAETTPARAKTPAVKSPSGPVSNLVYGPFNRGVVVIDPAHGGVDSGSRITDSLAEKNVTLALAFRLRSLLQARGFTVVLTRDSDAATEASNPAKPLTLDDRAGIANHARPVACLLLHATGSGTGVHLYRSELPSAATESPSPNWLEAQSPWATASVALSGKLADALERSHIPHLNAMASVRPVDSLECPALVVELAPRDAGDGSTTSDAAYQSQVADAIAAALVFWRNTAQPPPRAAAADPAHSPVSKPAKAADALTQGGATP